MLGDDLQKLAVAAGVGCCIGVSQPDRAPMYVFGGDCVLGGAPISRDTIWEAASLSKPVVALLALESSGQDPDLLTDPLVTSAQDFGAEKDDRWDELTLCHLLTHTSGLPNWRSKGEPLSFESNPGTPGYSGEGYELLLAELSERSNLSADVLLARHLERIDMSRSSFTPELLERSNLAIGHLSSGQPVSKLPVDSPRASGSLHTTVEDYMTFLSTVAGPNITQDADAQHAAIQMAERSLVAFAGHGRTLGWASTATASGEVLWQHGDNPGFKHIAAIRPNTSEAVVVLTNSDDGQGLYREVCKRALDVEVW